MKKLISVLILFLLIAPLPGCKAKEPDEAAPAPQAQAETPFAGARTASLLGTELNGSASPVHLALRMPLRMGGEEASAADVNVYMLGGAVAGDFTLPGYGRLGTLSRGGESYVFWHDGSTALTGSDAGLVRALGLLAQGHDEAYYTGGSLQWADGNEKLSDTAYDYEELTDGGVTTRFYYDPATGRLRYLRTDGALIEVVGYDSAVPDGVFDVPANYDRLDYAAFMQGLGGSADGAAYGFAG
ncbi:MAG: hypothetical protein VB021_08055 [Oscillospiraceae bacterium]|nr:hypothetical protein [Oscillospiraceae bacterium]